MHQTPALSLARPNPDRHHAIRVPHHNMRVTPATYTCACPTPHRYTDIHISRGNRPPPPPPPLPNTLATPTTCTRPCPTPTQPYHQRTSTLKISEYTNIISSHLNKLQPPHHLPRIPYHRIKHTTTQPNEQSAIHLPKRPPDHHGTR